MLRPCPNSNSPLAAGEKEFVSRDLARKWLTVNLPENIRDGFYKQRQEELRALLKRAEELSQAPVLSVMTDTKGTAYFTELPTGNVRRFKSSARRDRQYQHLLEL